jgi:peptidoglycan/xylan/chitin deacetylase (PgdA/CDA1 family)
MNAIRAGRRVHEAKQSARAPGGARSGTSARDLADAGARDGREGAGQPRVPQFVSFGFDDNAHPDGIEWALNLLRGRTNADGSPLRASFFVTAMYLEQRAVVHALDDALADAHEIGNHTYSHAHGGEFSIATWRGEIDACNKAIDRHLGARVRGFRAPFLEWNDAAFVAVREAQLEYDCSVYEDSACWPSRREDGLWSLPVQPMIVPPELARRESTITGFDYNLWVLGAMSAGEVKSTLAHTLDAHLRDHRAPLFVGMHSDLYSKNNAEPMRETLAERRLAIEEFLDYALAKPDVRVVSHAQVLDYVNAPRLLP